MPAFNEMIGGNGKNSNAASTTDTGTDDLFAPVAARPIPPSPFGGGEKKTIKRDRKVYLLQPQSAVVADRYGFPGEFYVESDPNEVDENGDRVVTKGRSTGVLEMTVVNWGREQSFNRGTDPICYAPDSPEGLVGHPTDKGKAAPYNIVEGQACQTCVWLKKFTAPNQEQNGYCSRIVVIWGIVEDANGKQVKVKMSLRNTAAKVGDEVLAMFHKHTKKQADGTEVYEPFKVRFTSSRGKGQAFYSPAVEEVA